MKNNRWFYQNKFPSTGRGVSLDVIGSIGSVPRAGPIRWTDGLGGSLYLKAQPHAAMLHTCDGAFRGFCDATKLHAMLCDAFSNMLVILLPILEYLSFLLSDFQTFFYHDAENLMSVHLICVSEA